MKARAQGARRLPVHHLTVRVPWHDSGWAGTVCQRPLENTSCLILPHIGEGKRGEVEARCADQRFDQVGAEDLPPCVAERASFMAPSTLTRSAGTRFSARRRLSQKPRIPGGFPPFLVQTWPERKHL